MPRGQMRDNPIRETARRVGAAVALAGLLLAGAQAAQATTYNNSNKPENQSNPWTEELKEDVGVAEQLNSPIDLGLTLIDEEGAAVDFASFFVAGRPVVINLGYSRCPSVCVLMRQQLTNTLADTGLELGEDFIILNISIDPNETPEQARAVRDQTWAELGEKGLAPSPEGWRFLTADQETITKLTGSVGYKYFYITPQDEYGHPGVLVLADGEGVIRRYLSGTSYSGKTLRLSIVETSQGKAGGFLDQAFLTCFRWDQDANNYAATAKFIMMIAGGVTLVGLAGLVLVGFAYERRRRKLLEQDGGAGVPPAIGRSVRPDPA